MRALLTIAAVATAAFAVPAQADDQLRFSGGPALTPHQLNGPAQFVAPPSHFNRRHHGGRHRGFDGVVFAGGPWSYDFDGNRSFDPDKWNDWWHERPERSYPAWMRRNQGCQRMWWSGGGWTC